MEVVVATQPSSVREMGNIKGRRAWARGGAHFQDMSLRVENDVEGGVS